MICFSLFQTGTIPPEVCDALSKTFKSDPDSHARIVWFLADRMTKGLAEPFVTALQDAIRHSPTIFKGVADRIARDTKTAENDPIYLGFMQDVWSNYLRDNEDKFTNGNQEWTLQVREDSVSAATYIAFMRAVAKLPKEQFGMLLQAIRAIGRAGKIAQSLTSFRQGAVGAVALASAYLSYDIMLNIRQWWNGEISGKRCVKNILDTGVSLAAGVAGSAGGYATGAAIGGAVGGPVGALWGALGGAMVGGLGMSISAQWISDRLTQRMFGLPKSVALEKAYDFLGVPPSASNSEINSRFRQLALLYHPDKKGNEEQWMQLQYSQALIKAARREYY